MLRVETSEVKRTEISSEDGDALIENGGLLDCEWGAARPPSLDFSDLTRANWIDLMTFLTAVWQEIVGKHGVIMALAGDYIWVEFEEGADLESIVTYYCDVYKMREGKEPNTLVLHPCQKLLFTKFYIHYANPVVEVQIVRSILVPIGTFRIGYEEPKDAKAAI